LGYQIVKDRRQQSCGRLNFSTDHGVEGLVFPFDYAPFDYAPFDYAQGRPETETKQIRMQKGRRIIQRKGAKKQSRKEEVGRKAADLGTLIGHSSCFVFRVWVLGLGFGPWCGAELRALTLPAR
jgi:hypothetical protein